jgi:D-sedoheptulose 7-phosphate isomerase
LGPGEKGSEPGVGVNDRPSPSEVVQTRLAELAELATRASRELAADVASVAEKVRTTLHAGGKILFCGNGGSAADAQHLAAEYVVRFARDRRPLAALALTTDTSVLTAAGNDLGFDAVFERQVQALGRSGDVLVLNSTSGESENLLRAATAARAMGIVTIAFLARDGGRLGGAVDHSIVVPTMSTAHAQELHLALGHIVCDLVEQTMSGGG